VPGKSGLRYLSLYTGAGGLDAGLLALGADCVAAIERDIDSCDTLRLNGHQHVIQTAIEDLPPASMRAGLAERAKELDLIVGGPPCQPFSKSALWSSKAARGLADERSTTLSKYLEYVEEFRPKGFILENVEGFARWGGLAFLESRLDDLATRGLRYTLSWRIVDAAAYGVPQHRRRFIAVGTVGSEPFKFPAPQYGRGLQPVLTAWDAISDIQADTVSESLAVRGRWANLLPSIPPGHNYLWHTRRGGGLPLFGWRTRFWSFLLKLHPDRPSPTIVASPSQNSGPFHWENRLLCTAEMAALQTFPATYRFAGDRASRQRQLGNAVPPLLAAVLGAAVFRHLGSEASVPEVLHVKRADTRPSIPPLGEVPGGFRSLEGNHADHPGTGKGPRPRGADLDAPLAMMSTGSSAPALDRQPLDSRELNEAVF
jgi:DNA (cytosine-5)-methyltransferase 1